MKLYIKSILSLGVIITMALGSCKKENISLENKFPDIPVTVPNKMGTFIAPTVSTSLSAGGVVKIVLEIPSGSGKTIKEITRVAAGTSYTSVQVNTGLYNSTGPIAGNGTNSITFNTTLTEYSTKTGLAMQTPATSGTVSSFLGRNFYFMITLNDGQELIPTYVRVYVDK